MKVEVVAFFRWYDLWVGAYYDRKERQLYVCPLPMIGVRLSLKCAEEESSEKTVVI